MSGGVRKYKVVSEGRDELYPMPGTHPGSYLAPLPKREGEESEALIS